MTASVICCEHEYGNRQFWCKGYYVDTVGRNKKAIAEYIRNQLAEDKISDQMTIKEYYDPFTGEPVNKSKYEQPHLVGLFVKGLRSADRFGAP